MGRSLPQVLVVTWAIGGVVLILVQAVARLSVPAMRVFDGDLTAFHWVAAGLWTAFMVYAEAWRGFHRQFNPRVIVRALRLAQPESPPLLLIFAPFVAMGLIHGTPRRLKVSRTLLAGIVLLVLGVRLLPHPWRAIIDVGVVCGLVGGLLSLVGFTVGLLLGRVPAVADDFPSVS